MQKATVLVVVFLGCLVVMTGCRKDDMAGGIMLTTERFMQDGVKTSVVGDEVHWVNGDAVRINGQTGTVEVSGSTARAVGFESLSGAIRGYYPSSIITATGAANENTDSPTIVFPHRYASSFSGSSQIIGLPMVGRASEGATAILFKHLSAAVNVRVKNSTGREKLYLDSVIVVSADKQLCGAASVTMSSSDDPTVSGKSNVEANRSVVVYFDEPVLISGDYLQVQVPILPVAGGELTFKVYTHALMSDIYPGVAKAHYSYNYSRALSNNALGRNVMGTVQIAVTGASDYVTEVNRGLFTINKTSGAKVRFSQGNLQYQASSGTWRFAENQYEYIGDAAGNNIFGDSRATQSAWIDLYGWGTSGWNNGNALYEPWNNGQSGSGTYGHGYGPRVGYTSNVSLVDDYAESDWGVYNSISNGGSAAGLWRTSTSVEWQVILNSRDASTINGTSNAHFAKASVNGVYGLIIFPDAYAHPNCVSLPSNINVIGSGGWTSNVYLLSDWKEMEAMGAVFLPITARTGVETLLQLTTGNYWSTTVAPVQNGNARAFCMYFSNLDFSASSSYFRYYGMAVRLVKDIVE